MKYGLSDAYYNGLSLIERWVCNGMERQTSYTQYISRWRSSIRWISLLNKDAGSKFISARWITLRGWRRSVVSDRVIRHKRRNLGIWKDVNPSITQQPAIEIVWRMEGVTQLVPVHHHLSMVGLIFSQHCWYYMGSLFSIGASGSENKETHILKKHENTKTKFY